MPLPPAAPDRRRNAGKPPRLPPPAPTVPVPAAAPATAATGKPRGGWIIQVGAFDTETEAKRTPEHGAGEGLKDLLGQANPFTEKMAKGDKTMYRARFAGLDRNQAESACKNLKRSDIPCMLLKN